MTPAPSVFDHVGGSVSKSDNQEVVDALRAARDELEQVYRTAPVGMCLVDAELRYVRINQLLADINMVPIDQHIGKTIAEVIPKLAPYIEPAYRQVLKTGQPITNIEIQTTTPKDQATPKDWGRGAIDSAHIRQRHNQHGCRRPGTR